ncbi:MAG: HEPN domain-containing protein [Phycisphaerae bacterium]
MSDLANDRSDPGAWLARAQSCLKRARLGHGDPEIFLDDLCFDAQQAVEKALKALLIARGVRFPSTHIIADLVTLLKRAGNALPESAAGAVDLTPYAVRARYPGGPELTEEDYRSAVRIAEGVVAWVKRELAAGGPAE